MLTPEHIRHTLDQYMAAINAGDVSAVMALYADDAAVEDPAGTEPRRVDEILELYTNALAGGAKVELTGPVRISAKTAAFPLRVKIYGAGGQVTIVEDILILEFDPAGKVAKMTAHWGPADMTVKNA